MFLKLLTHQCKYKLIVVFDFIGGFVQDFEGAQYILRFCQRESLTTEKIEVKRYYNDWNTY